MSERYEVYRMFSRHGNAAVIGSYADKAYATAQAKMARALLKEQGFSGVKVVVRDTSKRINPDGVDPFATLAAAAALGWNLATNRRLAKLEEKRANPGGLKNGLRPNFDHGTLLTDGAPMKRKSRKNPSSNATVKRIAELEAQIAEIKRHAAGAGEWTEKKVSRKTGRGGSSEVSSVRRKNPLLLLASNPGGKLVTRGAVGFSPNDPAFKKALAKYREFHLGSDPKEVTPVRVPKGTPRFLISLGKAPEVTYDPPAHSKKGGGPPFLHDWDDPPFLAMNHDGSYLGYVGFGKKYKVTERGIEG